MTTYLTVYDTVGDVAGIPASAEYFLWYVSGNYKTEAEIKSRFPRAIGLSVDVNGSLPADIIDVEKGDASAALAAERLKQGWVRAIYCSVSTKPDVDKAMGTTNWPWLASDWTGTPHVPDGALGCQWDGNVTGPDGYDVSLIDEAFFGIQPPAPTPTTTFDTDHMEVLMTLAASKQDAFNCQVREWWLDIRKSYLTAQDLAILWYAYNYGFKGSIDAVLANVIDVGTKYGDLKPGVSGA